MLFLTLQLFFVFLLIVFFGTIVAFILYLTGVNIIGPTKASIIACIEPVAATICAILFLGVVFWFPRFNRFYMYNINNFYSCLF